MSTVNTSISPAEIPKVVQQEGRTHLGTLCCTSVRLCSFEAHRKGPLAATSRLPRKSRASIPMMFLSLLCSHMAFGPVHMASQLRPAIHARAASSPSMLLDGSTFQLLADAILLPDAQATAAAQAAAAAAEPGWFDMCAPRTAAGPTSLPIPLQLPQKSP